MCESIEKSTLNEKGNKEKKEQFQRTHKIPFCYMTQFSNHRRLFYDVQKQSVENCLMKMTQFSEDRGFLKL